METLKWILLLIVIIIGVKYRTWWENKYYKPEIEKSNELKTIHKIGMIGAILMIFALLTHRCQLLLFSIIVFGPIILYGRFKLDFKVFKKRFNKNDEYDYED